MPVDVAPLAPDDWPRLRDLRERSLRGDPDAFWATWADEALFTEERWRGFATTATWFVALDGGTDVGIAGVVRRPEEAGSAEVIGMWVDPASRGLGTARALLEAVDSWAVPLGVDPVVLWVVDHNEAARAAYARLGFAETGETAPMPTGRAGTEIRMSRHPAVATEQELAGIEADRAAAHAEAATEPKPAIARVEEVDADGVPARLYVPDAPSGALLYLHGGGFALGDLVTHDGIARRLADRTGWAVLLPDYRRSPEHAWPAAAEDAAAAADWLAGTGFDRLAVLGDSAGSALAIGEALRHPERYVGQVQVYPFVDPSGASYDSALTDVDLPIDRARLFWRLYLQGSDAADDAALHVLDRGDLTGQPPALVQLAELDVLTPTGRRYAERLAEAGVPARVELYRGVQHGFWRRSDNDQSGPALDAVAAFLSAL